SIAILISLVVSLTTTPMMCAYIAMHRPQHRRSRWYVASERVFDWMLRSYDRTLQRALRRPALVMLVLLLTIVLNIYLFIIVPKGLFPQQDTGRMVGGLQADQSISFQMMRQKLRQFVRIVGEDPAVASVVGFTGGGQTNSGFMFVALKPLAERDASVSQVIGRLRPKLGQVAGDRLFLQPVQDIRVGGRQSNALYQYTLQSDDLNELYNWSPKVTAALEQFPELTEVNSDQQQKGLEADLVIDRPTAARLGLTVSQIDNTLYDAFGQRQVSTIYAPRNQYHVVMEVAPEFWQNPDTLDRIFISTAGGTVKGTQATNALPGTVSSNNRPATNGMAANSASTAAAQLNAQAVRNQATNARGNFAGTAQLFEKSLANEPILVAAALVAVYIVLGVLYESYIHPITILSTLPSAGVGAVLALMLFNIDFSIIALIGVILLIGIVKKNAIMMIDFALAAERNDGL